MGTVFRNPHWLVPDNANKTKKANYSLDFDGASSYVDVGPFNLGIDASVSMWFNPASIGPTDYVLLGEGANGFDYFIRRSSGSFFVWIGSTFYNFGSTITNNIINDAWNFLVITKDRGQVTVHLRNSNGNFSVSQTESAWQTAVVRFDRIGARTINPVNLPFEGKICQVSAYSYILSNDDISTLYGDATDGVGDPLSLDTLPVAYFPLGNELIYNNSGFICPNMVNSEKGSGNFLSTDFDGINDFITTSNSSDYKEVENDWTLSYWMKTPDAGSNQRNLTSGSGFFQYSNTYFNNGLYFYQTFPGAAWVKVTDSLEDDQWHNIVIRCQGGTTHECYVDGVQTYSNSGGQFPSSGAITTIGAYAGGTVRHFNGRISQVALFSNSTVDAVDLYNGGIQPDVTTFSDLEMLWDGGRNSKIANGGMVYTDAVDPISVYTANNFSFEALVSDTPNSSSGSGIAQGVVTTSLVATAPYTVNNVISRNSSGFSQLLPFGADQSNVADPTKLNITLQTGLYNGDLIGKFPAANVVSGAMIDWGDGSAPVPLVDGANNHTYSNHGLYNVKVSGTFSPYFNNDVYARNYVDLAHWGNDVVYPNMYVGLRGAWNLDITAYDSPTLVAAGSGISWGYCFQNCKRLTNANGSIANWDMSNTVVGGTTSTGLVAMFQDAPRFNVDISRWNLPSTGVSLVNMFRGAKNFNQPIGEWNISPVNCEYTFGDAHKFNQPLTNWTLPASVNFMFRNTRSFNSYPGAFNSATTSVQYMFSGQSGSSPSIFNQDISGWDVSNVTNFSNMLANATSFNQPIGNWTINTTPGNTVAMNGMLYNADSFNQNLSSWDMRNVNTFTSFQSYKGTGINPTGTNTESLVTMSQGFRRTPSNDPWIANIDTSQLSNIYYAFEGNGDLDQDLGGWDISKIITATFAFGNTPSFSTTNVTSTLTKWAIKNYLNNARKDVNVGTANIFSGRTFDNAQTSDTAGTPFPFPTNFTMSLVGTPDVGGSGDHCKIVNVSGDNQLEARDMACTPSDNVTFETLVLGGGNGSNNNVSVTIPYYWDADSSSIPASPTTGIVADYKIDGGAWTNFLNDTVTATSGTSGSNASPSIGTVSGLSFNTSFQVRFTLQCGNSSNGFCNVKEVVINKGTTNIFTEDFSNQLGVGWDNNVYTAANPAFANAGEALDYFIDPNGGNWINAANGVTRIN